MSHIKIIISNDRPILLLLLYITFIFPPILYVITYTKSILLLCNSHINTLQFLQNVYLEDLSF